MKQSFESYFSNMIYCQNFIEPELFQPNFQPNCDLQMKAQTMPNMKDENINRGKGRPKGENNSKDKEKERKQKSTIDSQNRKRGHWSSDENKKYHWFLEKYNKHFICKEMRRLDKIFKTMALFIGTREAQQCRSHHQKMQKKYHTFSNILLYLRKLHYGSQDHKLIYQDMVKNQIKQEITFLNVSELQQSQTPKVTPPTPSVIEESKLDLGGGEQQVKAKIQFQQDYFNLLGEEYEHMLHLNNNLF